MQSKFTYTECVVSVAGVAAANGYPATELGTSSVENYLYFTQEPTAQLHAVVSVAGVAAAVAAIATASSGQGQSGEKRVKADTAVASVATLFAAQCVEAAEAMGAEKDHLASVVTLTATAATALRGAATLKVITLKDVWNALAETPLQRAMPPMNNLTSKCYGNGNYTEELDGYTP